MMEHTNESIQYSNLLKSTDSNWHNNKEHLQLLHRAVRQEDVFRIVFIQHNLYTTIETIATFLKENFPERSLLRIKIKEENYNSLMQKIYAHQGLLVLENFQSLVLNPDMANGFNQRRDRISELPIQIIAFLPHGIAPLKNCAEKIKDFWSIRNLILTFGEVAPTTSIINLESLPILDKETEANKIEELNRILNRIQELKQEAESSDVIFTLYEQASQLLYDLSRFKEGLELTEEWEFWTRKYMNDNENVLRILIQRFPFLVELGNYIHAQELLEKANVLAVEMENQATIASIYINLGVLFQKRGNYEEAIQNYEASIKIDEEIGNIVGIATALNNIGIIFQDKGNYQEAIKKYKASLKIKEELRDISGVAGSLHNIGIVLQKIEDYEEAIKNYEASLEIQRLIGNIAGIASSYGQLGLLYFQLKNWEAALTYFSKSHSIFEKIGSPNAQLAEDYIHQIQGTIGEKAFQQLRQKIESQLED